ncbi:RagB/SusD family nutrient uptake outer membrane protein [Pedobacter frigiditerrae]|uniref:RagB/SusD family nutrient uptake outer membrane protein n=1 Tax=Pedobacter frigiditerrae TaxID=2530452 RepID=A0A4R0MPV3_9SPHI|nr:RagB/SusD family nutrient uptake outer membrane protein [Pedobacter frigiditerrae]TCC88683.1 RagB/SusD family nutrient uptake outer membrane protein [Pedobacter frigiditerrae]
MKNIKYLIALCAVFMTFSCQKLDREISTSIGRDLVDKVYINKSREIANLYTGLPDGMFYMGNAMMASATDEAEHTDRNASVQSFNTGGVNTVNNPDDVWFKYYRMIRAANQALVSLDKIDLNYLKNNPNAAAQTEFATKSAEIKRWEFEARVLRAYYYFELVKRYGGVPLVKESLSLVDTDFSQIPRASLDECIKFIVNECDVSAPQLPPYADLTAYDASLIGRRVNKYTAMALKSRMLLYAASDLFNNPSWAGGYSKPEFISLSGVPRAKRWEDAANAAKSLIDVATANGVGLNPNYRDLFLLNNFNIGEVFLTVNTSTASNQFERNNYPVGYPSGGGLTTPTQNLVDAYEVKTGTGVTTATSTEFDWANATHVTNIYNFIAPASTVATSVTRDPRLNYNIVTNGIANTPTNSYGVTFGTTARFVQTYINGLDAAPKANASRTGYYIRKYVQEGLNLSNNNTAVHNWVLFRLSEVYLNYAEALNEYNPGNADIAKYVNLVRSRGSGVTATSPVSMPPLPVGLSQSAMQARIRNERRVELAFEDHRYWDLRRWMDETNLKADVLGVSITGNTRNTFVHNKVKVEERVFSSKMYFYPIAYSELTVAKGLVQNPLW